LLIAAMLCLLPPAIAQQPGETVAPGDGDVESSGTDFSKPITLSLHPPPVQFDIRKIEFIAEVDSKTLAKSLKDGAVPIRLTVINHGGDGVVFSNAVITPGSAVEIYAEDESYKKKLIFPSSSKKLFTGNAALTEVRAGQSVSVLLQMPLPVSLLNSKYKDYIVCMHLLVPRLGHTFEVFSAPFSISPVKAK
jgi:hypothetical protein